MCSYRAFNSPRVLLEPKELGVAQATITAFNSPRVLLEHSFNAQFRESGLDTFNSPRVLLEPTERFTELI